MRTKDELFREAQRHITARRQSAVTRAEQTRAAAFAGHPALAAADEARTQAGLALALAAARGRDLAAARAALRQAEDTLLAETRAAGYRPQDFEPQFQCPACRDTGIAAGSPCGCVAALARTLRRQEINAASPLELCGFDSFDLGRYATAVQPELGISTRDYMEKILQLCRGYAQRFSLGSPSLMFTGTAGLGKTHMALAIADAVLDRGFDVLYTSAAALAAQLGREHFDRENPEPWLDACKEADLLILDDLGTEYVSALTISVLYELINTRMLTNRPTVYTSNITDHAVFEARYTEKIASRMLGGCKEYRFFGTDQRRK